MAKVFGINTKIRGKVGEYIYRQTKVGTVVSEAPVKPITPLRTQSQMNIRTQWANLGAIYKQFDSMLRRGFEELPPQMSVYNAFIQANLGVVKVYITKRMKLNGGAILAPYQITRGSLPSISMTKNNSNILVSSVRLGTLTISATTTVAQFSQAVIDNNASFLEGDQITFFHGIQTVDTVTRTPRASITGYKVVLSAEDHAVACDLVSTDLLGGVDTRAFAEGSEADVAEALQLDALAAREVAADGAVEGFQHRYHVGVAHGGDFGYLVAQLVGRDAAHGDGGGIVLAGLCLVRPAEDTFVICHKFKFYALFPARGDGVCPDSIRARLDSVWTRLDSVWTFPHTHRPFDRAG